MAKRNYPDNGYSSVTQVLGVLRKIGLEFWFKYNTRKFCDEESNKGKLIGTQIHDAIESFITTGKAKLETEYDEDCINALNSFMLFKKENTEIELKLSEIPLTSETYKFNGTIDAPNPPILVDWKSGKAKDKDAPAIYDEYKYQVAAYVYLWNENNPNSLIDTAYIVSLAKDKVAYGLYKMDKKEIDDCFNRVFLQALSIIIYQKEFKQKQKENKNG